MSQKIHKDGAGTINIDVTAGPAGQVCVCFSWIAEYIDVGLSSHTAGIF